MSPSSAPKNSLTARQSGKASSHNYFSRLSKQIFKTSAPNSAALRAQDPSSSSLSPSQRTSNSPPHPHPHPQSTKRLCALKRKSNNYFSTQARILSPPPGGLEATPSSNVISDRAFPSQEINQDGMGNQESTPVVLDTEPVLRPRSRDGGIGIPSDGIANLQRQDIGISHSAEATDGTAGTEGETGGSRRIEFVGEEVLVKEELSPPPLPATATATATTKTATTMTTPLTAKAMKRPLPPPKSRYTVREEAKRAREIIDLCDDAGSVTKKVKLWREGHTMLPEAEPVKNVVHEPGKVTDQLQAWTGRVKEQQLQQHLRDNRDDGSCAKGGTTRSTSTRKDIRNGNATTRIASKPLERKRKKLFGTLAAKEAPMPLQHWGTIPHESVRLIENPDLDTDPSLVTYHQAGGSGLSFTNGAVQHVNGQHRQRTSQDEVGSLSIDEGYSSFSLPDADDEDDNACVPENEDELMKRINGSLGLSSPFVQTGREKASKVVTPEQAYAEQQQARDVERSQRMREANLAAKMPWSKHSANGGRGLSVGFLEDLGPNKDRVETRPILRKSANCPDGGVEHRREPGELMNGGKCTLANGRGQFRRPESHELNATKHLHGETHATLLDIAENYVRKTSTTGSIKANQRSSADDKSFRNPVTDFEVLGFGDRDVTQPGSIQPLEQQRKSGENEERPTSASDMASSRSVISQLTPKRSKTQEVGTSETSSTFGPEKACSPQVTAEARLLQLRNAPVSGNTFSETNASPTSHWEGGLLDELVRRSEGHKLLSAESSVSGPQNRSTKGSSLSKHGRKANHKLNKDIAAATDAVLLRMGIPASLSKDWTDRRKIGWMRRENKLTAKQTDILATLIADHNVLQDADQTPISPTGTILDNGKLVAAAPSAKLGKVSSKSRRPDKGASSNVAAAENILRDSCYKESVLETFSNQKKCQHARLETELVAARQKLANFRAKQDAQERKAPTLASSAEKRANDSSFEKGTAVTSEEDPESEESEEEEGWQFAIRWQGIEQPKKLADTVSLTAAAAKIDTTGEGSEKEEDDDEEEDRIEEPEEQDQTAAGSTGAERQITPPIRFPNRQKPDADLLRQMQQKRYEDWSDEEEDEVHEYVVKAETWGMTKFAADQIFILGRYINKDKAEEMVRCFILSSKPSYVARSLEIQSVWTDGNFSQKLIRDGEAGCRAFVEPEIVSARQYPGLRDRLARRKMYAVCFERTISQMGADGALEEHVTATTVDDMQVFTTKSLANWQAKKQYQEWYKEHLSSAQDSCWLRMHDENLCTHLRELNEEGMLFERKEHIRKEGATDKMKVWVKEIAPKGPRN